MFASTRFFPTSLIDEGGLVHGGLWPLGRWALCVPDSLPGNRGPIILVS